MKRYRMRGTRYEIMNSKGTTLIETTVVIVLLGITGLFVFQFVGSGVETHIMAANQAGLLAEAKLAVERMAREIRDANSILVPASGSSGNSINFIKSHSTVVDSATDITFQINAGTLQRNSESLAENVSNFTVTNNSNEIKLELTLSLSGGETVTLHTKIYPKNLPFDPSKDFGGTEFNGEWEEVIQ
ncbi:MAG: type II secretion system protein [Desulfobacteraceae bacterium]|nr:type II secretion system protein [Desulfobacteraceae bacterium]